MPIICAEDRWFDVDCVVFDKDGTLLDFEQAWVQRILDWIDELVTAVDGDDSLTAAMYHMFGIDLVSKEMAIDGPIMTVSGEKMATLSAAVLYAETELPWHEAERVAAESLRASFDAPLLDSEIQPLGDVKGTLQAMRAAGIAIVVATADDRLLSQRCLDLLDIGQSVSLLMCGDDPLPQKPDAAVLEWIAKELNTEPDRILVVGDTINDLLTGLNGRAAGTIAISPTGSSNAAILAPYADVVLPTVDGLQVECNERGH